VKRSARQRRDFLATAALLLLVAAAAPAVAGGPSWCLPPLFEGGQRLHAMPAPTAFWLAPLLRQHELCHAARARPDEPRAILIGNSAVFGHPLPAAAALGGRLNQLLAVHGVPGRVYNLGWVNAYELRDAVILNAALDYQPDLIIYPLTLADFQHGAPSLFEPIAAFFASNDSAVRDLARARPAGLEEPFDRYESAYAHGWRAQGYWARLRDLGTLARTAAQTNATALARWADPTLRPPVYGTTGRVKTYDCLEVTEREELTYRDWQSWNVLAYLDQLRASSGVQVLVVNWPVAYEPVGACFNARHSAAAIEEFNRWLRAECAARNLPFVDLHDLLAADQFFDSIHPIAEGHRRIAEQLAPAVESALRVRRADAQRTSTP